MRAYKPKFEKLGHVKATADTIYSRLLRLGSADENGMVVCFSCGELLHFNQAQCGHYVSRNHNILRFDKVNTQIQCKSCNIFKSGNLTRFAVELGRKYGYQELERLDAMRNDHKHFTIPELKEMMEEWKPKLQELENRFKTYKRWIKESK